MPLAVPRSKAPKRERTTHLVRHRHGTLNQLSVRGDESEQTERGGGGEGVRENSRRSGVARINPSGQRPGVRDEDEADATGDACCTAKHTARLRHSSCKLAHGREGDRALAACATHRAEEIDRVFGLAIRVRRRLRLDACQGHVLRNRSCQILVCLGSSSLRSSAFGTGCSPWSTGLAFTASSVSLAALW